MNVVRERTTLLLRRAGRGGEDVVDHHLNAARVEQETHDSMVHLWDRERYLERG